MGDTLFNLAHQTGFFNLTVGNVIMIAVALGLLYLAIVKEYEPLLLLPISFGMLLVNLYPPIMEEGGLLHYFFMLDEWTILPSLIFLGVGALTDFGPLIANPKSFLLGAAAQFGVFGAFLLAMLMGFTEAQAAAVSIIGGADGPTSIFLAMKLGQRELMGPIAVAAYSYMSLVPIIQPPIMKALTTEAERRFEERTYPVPYHRYDRSMPHTAFNSASYRNAHARQPLPRERSRTPAAGYSFQRAHVHCSNLPGNFSRSYNQCGSIPQVDYNKDRHPRNDSIQFRYSCRSTLRKTHVQAVGRQDQPAHRFCRCIRGSYGGESFTEGRRRSRSYELPAHACHGP